MAHLATAALLAGLVALFAVVLDAQDTGDQAVAFQPVERCPGLPVVSRSAQAPVEALGPLIQA
jgi:hypothetical protein